MGFGRQRIPMLAQTAIQTGFYTLCVIGLTLSLTGVYAPTEALVWTALGVQVMQ